MSPPLTRRHRGRGLAVAVALAACGGEPRPPVEYAVDLAEDVPMTGLDDPNFAEVDVVMRQFLKWRCGGAGTLAISYRGRRVYKRGFGRMRGRATETLYEGCGDDESNPYDPDAPLVEPDAPMYIGSLSKALAAATVRRLLEERLEARPELRPPACEGPICACEEPPCPGSVADLVLLDPANDLLPESIAAILRGDAPVPVPQSGDPCASGHDPAFADPRWREITIGNLISHQAGLFRSGSGFQDADDGVVPSLAVLRGYTDEAAWAAEDADLRADPGLAAAIEGARAWVGEREGGAPVYFVNFYNALAGERPVDELIKVSAGLCLDYSPGVSGMYGDEDGVYELLGQQGEYSNFALGVIGRVIDHLEEARTGGHYLPDLGHPEEHAASSLGQFLAEELGITEGVASPEGITMAQGIQPDPTGRPLYTPTPRIWSSGTFAPESGDLKRPYCVWRDGECDFRTWLKGRDGDVNLRPNVAFEIVAPDEGEGFRKVAAWATSPHQMAAAGALVAEGPAYLAFSNKYRISASSRFLDNGNGELRERWPDDEPGGHNGSIGGGYSFIFQLVEDMVIRSFPPRVDGHLVDDWEHLRAERIEIPAGVDLFVAVNQREDPRCLNQLGDGCSREYGLLRNFVYWGLAQVDWSAVEASIAAQRFEVRGMAIDAGAATHLWFADDNHRALAGPPPERFARPEVDDVADGVAPYALPSTRIGPDLLGAAFDAQGRVHAWYSDGRVSVGEALDLGATVSPVPFRLAEAHGVGDLVALAMSPDGLAHAWYADGTWSAGTPTELAASGGGTYSLPEGRAAADVAAIAFDPTVEGAVWVLFRDGAIELGQVDDLGAAP
ncbi:MAG: serine hydrolase [Myxococcales bacterium]|nr:serine hydrolase [Myxococcales bacterium]